MRDATFTLRKGPIFANIVLVDELNRATPKTQSALLEAMQERQVTIEGVSYPIEGPFMVLATQIRYGSPGTYPLTEVQVDRFAFKINLGYPSLEEELKILSTIDSIELEEVQQVATLAQISELAKMARGVYVSEGIKRYIVDIVDSIRRQITDSEYAGPSTRASVWLLKSSRAYALLHGRDFVIPDDVKRVAPHVLRHRIAIMQELEERLDEDAVIHRVLNTVAVPKG